MADPLDLPMREALDYWRGKIAVDPDTYAAMTEQARMRAFTVTHLYKQELIDAVQGSLQQALEKGTSLATWRREFLAAHGEDADAQAAGLTRKHRLDTIFRTNVQSAYMAGRYAQMQQTKAARPYWRYSAVGDARTRPAHAALHGLVYASDDPFWNQYYPPNGFNCRCTVTSASAREVAREGWTVETDLPGARDWTDPETGEVRRITPVPDPGWGNNVGKDWLSGLVPAEVEPGRSLPARHLCPAERGGRSFGADVCYTPLAAIDARHILPYTAAELLPKGLPEADYLRAFFGHFGIAPHQQTVLRLPGCNIPLPISRDLFWDKRTQVWKVTKEGREVYINLLARTIKDPYEVWWGQELPKHAPPGMAPQSKITLLRLFGDGTRKVGGFAAFTFRRGGWHGSTVFPPKSNNEKKMVEYLEQERRKRLEGGVLLYREP